MKWKKWSRCFFHFSYSFPTFALDTWCQTIKNKTMMKRLALLFVFCGMLMTAMADWTYGTAYFKGSQPSNCLSHGKVMIWYNGSLTQKGLEGGVEIWERLRVGELAREWVRETFVWSIPRTMTVHRCVSPRQVAQSRHRRWNSQSVLGEKKTIIRAYFEKNAYFCKKYSSQWTSFQNKCLSLHSWRKDRRNYNNGSV